MADTFSDLLGLRYQQTGGNDNTWGDLLNTDVFEVLENAVAGRAVHAVTGGTLDLSAAPLVEQVHKFTGVLTSDLTVIIPNLAKRMMVHNATSGAFAMLLKTASSTAVCIPQGTLKDIISEGSHSVLRLDRAEVGEIKYFGGTTAPAGFLKCDGSTPLRASTPDLFAAIGTTWGAGNGATTYTLPDLKTAGRFLRSRSGSVAAGTLQVADIAAHGHTASAMTGVTLTIAGDGGWTPTISVSDPGHFHTPDRSVNPGVQFVTFVGNSAGSSIPGGSNVSTTNQTSTNTAGVTATSTGVGNHAHAGSSASASTSISVNNSTGTETRPINASALACIRY
jgi:microcystin-dependent protein